MRYHESICGQELSVQYNAMSGHLVVVSSHCQHCESWWSPLYAGDESFVYKAAHGVKIIP